MGGYVSLVRKANCTSYSVEATNGLSVPTWPGMSSTLRAPSKLFLTKEKRLHKQNQMRSLRPSLRRRNSSKFLRRMTKRRKRKSKASLRKMTSLLKRRSVPDQMMKTKTTRPALYHPDKMTLRQPHSNRHDLKEKYLRLARKRRRRRKKRVTRRRTMTRTLEKEKTKRKRGRAGRTVILLHRLWREQKRGMERKLRRRTKMTMPT